jgi:hypothetical protein
MSKWAAPKKPRAAAIEEADMARSSDVFGLPQFFARLLELWRLCRRY